MRDHDDQDLDIDRVQFRSAMADVRPLGPVAEPVRPPPPRPVPLQRIADDKAVLAELLDGPDPEGLESGEELAYARDGLQRRVWRKLRRGQYRLDAELDLHGLTVPLAREALREFFGECRQRDLGCVRVIHGKGRRSDNRGPVLKGKVDHWLRQLDCVLAFCSAQPRDGGSGAVYVLLRRPKASSV
ncbi:Smr/MutS family protein [Alkalilimnicola sp. S0819]|uniref:Smr/MutS family protein n=1 Tax=Alkalilimnicola sp. S0819 TaxID=2613922 RepID=UPI0012624379|nr:Smr/MutS family protein [Alkalilimnicola sp. S0819]KAB7627944.1 DNA mismatch repair protein MutS [Alkalilimnicola sp. S0819]MPQ15583.1 DNA mismatch repair protein MutS [Alkalilimnicola sp. S0819]